MPKDYNEPGNLVPKTVDEDPNLPQINVNGTLLHAETYGNNDSAMVIFLHGGPGADYRNGLNAKGLANEGYFVVFMTNVVQVYLKGITKASFPYRFILTTYRQ